jgi:hypothetical protein
VDACAAAGADQGTPAPSTASWLRNRLHLGASAATSCVRTARALFAGPLSATAQALCDGELSTAHASALAHGTHHLPTQVSTEAEPVLVEAARHLDPPRLRRVLGHLVQATDPDAADHQGERRHGRRGVWWATTVDGMVALQGLLEPEAGQTLTAALDPLARPATADDARRGDQRRADALVELARRNLEAGQLPQTGGVRPQLHVIVDLASLLGHHHTPGGLGGEAGGAGPLSPEACRRLACDGAVTRVVVTRHPTGPSGPPWRTIPSARGTSPDGCGSPWTGCHHPWAARRPSRWRSGGPAESSPRPSAAPWRSATGAVCSPTAPGPSPGARATTCGIGSMAAPPIWRIWPWCAEPTIGRSTTGAGS